MKWDDYKNALGSHDADEPGVAGITIYLDTNNNGQLDGGEPSTVTDANGNYSFTMLPAGTYHVREVLPEGYAQSFPMTPDQTINLAGGQIVTGVDFGNFEYIIIPDGKDEIYGSNGADRLLGDNEVGDPRTLSFGDDDRCSASRGRIRSTVRTRTTTCGAASSTTKSSAASSRTRKTACCRKSTRTRCSRMDCSPARATTRW
jgi:hypothetical protein